MKRFVLTVDLKDGPAVIEEYEAHHRAVWPEVLLSLRRIGIRAMDIYRLGRRLVMVMDTKDGFDRRRGFAAHVASDPRCAEWEELMKTYQQPPPGAKPGEVWALMEPVFHLGPPAGARRPRTMSGAEFTSAPRPAGAERPRTMSGAEFTSAPRTKRRGSRPRPR
jgi:L-rhamnose mutarotase